MNLDIYGIEYQSSGNPYILLELGQYFIQEESTASCVLRDWTEDQTIVSLAHTGAISDRIYGHLTGATFGCT